VDRLSAELVETFLSLSAMVTVVSAELCAWWAERVPPATVVQSLLLVLLVPPVVVRSL
jgi:hypothetical protein